MSKQPDDPEKKKRRETAAQAFEHYDQNQYSNAKSSLDSLTSQVTVEKDLIALSHNKLLSTFSSTPRNNESARNTLEQLQRIRARAAEHRAGKSMASTGTGETNGGPTTTEGVDGNESTNKVEPIAETPVLPSTSTQSSSSATSSSATPSPDAIDSDMAADPQMSTILFNEAVLCCSLGQFRSALVRLEALFQNLMLLDDWLAVRTCYLLLDIYIHVHRGLEANSEALQHLETCAAKILDALEQRATPNEEDNKNSSGSGSGSGSGSSNNDDNEPSSLKSTPDLKFHLKLYRAKLQLITSNSKNAKKEIKAALDIYNKEIKNDKTGTSAVAKKTSTPALCLKANLEYVRENFKKSVKLLNAALSNKTLHASLYMNNMGCVNFQSQRYAVSSMYFSRALALIDGGGEQKEGKNGNGGNAMTSSTTCINRCEVLFNIGLQMLMCDRDLETAFQCFHNAAEELHMRPRVWMRMAECCIAQHEKCLRGIKEERMNNARHPSTLSASTQYTTTFQNDMVASIINGRRVMLPVDNTSSDDGIPSGLAWNDANHTNVSMSLSYAMMCLRNVLHLTREQPNKDNNNNNTSIEKQKAATATATSNPDSTKTLLTEQESVRYAALASLSYCSLCQNHPIKALDYAKRLLSYSCSKGQQYVAHSYAAEALCTMNRCEEALVHLHALEEMASKKSVTVVDDMDNKGGLASAPTSAKARAALCVNLASIRIQQNELELAEKSLRQALLFSPSSMDALRGLVYLHLRQGQSKHAMQILQERRPNIR